MDGSPGKTPVSLLQEICTRKNVNPKYELLQVEGAVHEPTFQYRLSLEYNGSEYEQTGTGRSKKEAKHNTALSMLVSMGLLSSDEQPMEHDQYEAAPDGDDLRVGVDGDLGGTNPVGLLQELCMKLKHSPPTYEVHSEEGLPHERIFAMACRVGEHFVEVGRGKSKKLAKRQAAALMADRLRSIPSETSNVYDFDEDDDKICERFAAALNLKRNTSAKFEPDGSLLSKCQAVAIHKFSAVQDMDMEFQTQTCDPVKILAELEDSSFKILYIDVDELSTINNYQCFLQITSDPPIVAIGEGKTRDTARKSAAFDAINMFKDLINSTC